MYHICISINPECLIPDVNPTTGELTTVAKFDDLLMADAITKAGTTSSITVASGALERHSPHADLLQESSPLTSQFPLLGIFAEHLTVKRTVYLDTHLLADTEFDLLPGTSYHEIMGILKENEAGVADLTIKGLNSHLDDPSKVSLAYIQAYRLARRFPGKNCSLMIIHTDESVLSGIYKFFVAEGGKNLLPEMCNLKLYRYTTERITAYPDRFSNIIEPLSVVKIKNPNLLYQVMCTTYRNAQEDTCNWGLIGARNLVIAADLLREQLTEEEIDRESLGCIQIDPATRNERWHKVLQDDLRPDSVAMPAAAAASSERMFRVGSVRHNLTQSMRRVAAHNAANPTQPRFYIPHPPPAPAPAATARVRPPIAPRSDKSLRLAVPAIAPPRSAPLPPPSATKPPLAQFDAEGRPIPRPRPAAAASAPLTGAHPLTGAQSTISPAVLAQLEALFKKV